MTTRTRVPSPDETVGMQLKEAPADRLPVQAQAVTVHQPEPKLYPPKIAKAIIAITREIDPIVKMGKNTFHNYNYAKWESILDELSPLIAKHGLIITQSEIAHGGFESGRLIEITYEFTIVNEDGDVWPDQPRITAICKITDTKGIVDDKADSKCHTTAQKYMMTSLFKIRTTDVQPDKENDATAETVKKRPVPSPDGHVAPHLIEGVKGETAETWAKKFISRIATAKTAEEVTQWDELNANLLDLLKEKAGNLYNQAVDAINARLDAIKPKAEPTKADTKPSGEMPDIPAALRRFAPKPPSDMLDERVWLNDLSGAFSGCADIETLNEKYVTTMEPMEGKVGTETWEAACSLMQENVARIQGGD